MSNGKILELQQIRREFVMGTETVRALKGVSFDVFAGDFVTIMGSSGSGKTTLLNILGCLDKPSAGNGYNGFKAVIDLLLIKSYHYHCQGG